MATRKIYFAGSIRAGRNDAQLYAKILAVLKTFGTVLTEHVGDPNMTEAGMWWRPFTWHLTFCHADDVSVGDEALTDKQIHDRDVQWLTESDGAYHYYFQRFF